LILTEFSAMICMFSFQYVMQNTEDAIWSIVCQLSTCINDESLEKGRNDRRVDLWILQFFYIILFVIFGSLEYILYITIKPFDETLNQGRNASRFALILTLTLTTLKKFTAWALVANPSSAFRTLLWSETYGSVTN
jgi:hypothetical protein